jgi:hypothetical protein
MCAQSTHLAIHCRCSRTLTHTQTETLSPSLHPSCSLSLPLNAQEKAAAEAGIERLLQTLPVDKNLLFFYGDGCSFTKRVQPEIRCKNFYIFELIFLKKNDGKAHALLILLLISILNAPSVIVHVCSTTPVSMCACVCACMCVFVCLSVRVCVCVCVKFLQRH